MYKERLKKVRDRLSKARITHFFTMKPENIRYLSGFRGEESALLLHRQGLAVITDSRYSEEAKAAVKAARREGIKTRLIIRKKKDFIDEAAGFVHGRKSFVGVEEDSLSVSNWKKLRKALAKKGRIMPAGPALLEARAVKDAGELRLIRRAVKAAERAMLDVREGLKPGLTERRIAMMLHAALVEHGAEGPSFPIIVASGPGSSRPHYETSGRRLKKGEPLLIDWGAKVSGYMSDLTRVLFLGKMPASAGRAYEALIRAREKAVEAISTGEATGRVDKAAREAMGKYAGRFTHSLGHGIGLEVHEQPNISPASRTEFMPGMVFTIEPGIYIPGPGTPGSVKWGLRLEDDFAVKKGGATGNARFRVERLGALPYDLEWAIIRR